MAEQLLTRADVAEMLGVSTSWVHKKCSDGTLPHFRLGAALRFRRGDVEAWLEEQRRGWTPGRRAS